MMAPLSTHGGLNVPFGVKVYDESVFWVCLFKCLVLFGLIAMNGFIEFIFLGVFYFGYVSYDYI